jgi:hypothetical protein
MGSSFAPSRAPPEAVDAPTPAPTKLALLATTGLTVAAVVTFVLWRGPGAVDAGFAAGFLCVFSGLFILRVAGQVLVRTRRPAWLPPTERWNLTPYRLLLPTQLLFIALMAWIDVDFARDSGFWVDARPAFGRAVLWFAYAYASAMAVRYVVRMGRQPDQRWFGGTIPIVFHWVLASFLFVLGSFHASH